MTDPEAPQAPQQPLSLSEQIAWCRGELEWKAHHGWPDDELAAMCAVLTSLERLGLLVRAMADRDAALQAAIRERDEARAEIKRLQFLVERERSIAALALENVRVALARRDWLQEGRGSYEWDDDRWKGEFGQAINEVKAALEPLKTIAADRSDCPAKWEDVLAARAMQPNADDEATGPIGAFHAECPSCGAAVDVIPDVPLVPAAEAARSLQAAIRERDDMGEDVERLQADVAEAHDCIGRLQALVRNAEYWVSHGCSEQATEAMRQAMADSWSQMGWRDICQGRHDTSPSLSGA